MAGSLPGLNLRRYRRRPAPAIGVDASDQAAAEAKDAGMDPSACVFDTFHQIPCRGRDRTRAAPHLCLTHVDERGHDYVLASVGSRVALASRRAIGTEVSS